MNGIEKKNSVFVENMIYEINGLEVMLDSDLAKLYQVETKRINEAVKNNPQKFPQRFSWIMTNDELYNLWSKFSTANIKGELYDAYSVLIDIFNKSKEEIIIIDNYASKELLDIIKKYR